MCSIWNVLFVMNVSARTFAKSLLCFVVIFCLVNLSFYNKTVHRWYSKQATAQAVSIQSSLEARTATLGCSPSSALSDAQRRGRGKPPGGFVLAFHFWEQQTQAMKTVAQLQCLAHRMGMRAVEPFLYKSFLGFPFQDLATNDFLRLGDLIDIDLWNEETTRKLSLHPLSSWSEFLKISPRNLIVVCIRYRNPPQIHIPEPGFDYTRGCSNGCYANFNRSLNVLNMHGHFRIVRRACANFLDYAGAVAEKSFVDNILGEYDPREVTVLMNEFRGFFGLYRAQVLSSCGIDLYKPNITIAPSVAIMNDAAKYVAAVFNNQPYIAILARIERVVLHLDHSLTQCSTELQFLLQSLSKQYNTTQYFLAMDVGRFGSGGSNTHNLTKYGPVLLNAVYGGTMSFNEWESQFELYTSKVEEAYVANLQRAIAARSKCLVMFGAGGFQGQAREFYERQHPDSHNWCIHKICHTHRGAGSIHVHVS